MVFEVKRKSQEMLETSQKVTTYSEEKDRKFMASTVRDWTPGQAVGVRLCHLPRPHGSRGQVCPSTWDAPGTTVEAGPGCQVSPAFLLLMLQ